MQGGDKLAQVQSTLAYGDEARAAGLLLTMLSDAAGGAADVSSLAQEVVQVSTGLLVPRTRAIISAPLLI